VIFITHFHHCFVLLQKFISFHRFHHFKEISGIFVFTVMTKTDLFSSRDILIFSHHQCKNIDFRS